MKKFILGLIVLFGGLILSYYIIMIIGRIVYPYASDAFFKDSDTIYIRIFSSGLLTCIITLILGVFAYGIGYFIINFKKKW